MASKKKHGREEFKQEDILQAVVIADSFNVRFAPLTTSKPRVTVTKLGQEMMQDVSDNE